MDLEGVFLDPAVIPDDLAAATDFRPGASLVNNCDNGGFVIEDFVRRTVEANLDDPWVLADPEVIGAEVFAYAGGLVAGLLTFISAG